MNHAIKDPTSIAATIGTASRSPGMAATLSSASAVASVPKSSNGEVALATITLDERANAFGARIMRARTTAEDPGRHATFRSTENALTPTLNPTNTSRGHSPLIVNFIWVTCV